MSALLAGHTAALADLVSTGRPAAGRGGRAAGTQGVSVFGALLDDERGGLCVPRR